MEDNGSLLIAKIVGTHGIEGTFRVYSYAESLSVFKPDSSILIRDTRGYEEIHVVNWAKPHKQIILLSLKGITNISQAEPLIGSELFISESDLPKLEDETYYWFNIIGLSVFTIDDKYIGRIESIIPTGSNDVFVVKDGDKEILIPGLESVVLSIDLNKKIMRVDLPDGL
ncbi:MAG: ribosome maturation factor RimM [Proteobacteria bacterium]|nr:ribosome maturation factor RimM [Pseudomonadota bacterium]MBU4258350.1 ribosome maturation factor RimM [Pseudomonadota bacterium]MBU4287318.1 ribosome maturation factor RimM [Pseudomonadota bacterium]MCG2759200.1 ribosome maturation factor RimM [Desulfobacteraceae bacterium]